jgi:hypothetical protein
MRVLVCGGRDYKDWEHVEATLNALDAENHIDLIIQGEALGADLLGKHWAWKYMRDCHCFAADWKAHGRKAGPLRNMEMLWIGKPDLVVAFPGGTGTAHMVQIASDAGVEVLLVEPRVSASSTSDTH